MSVTLVYRGECLGCDQKFGPGDEKVDREVERHGKQTNHGTITRIERVESR